MTAIPALPRAWAASSPNPHLMRLTLLVALTALPVMAAYGLDGRMFQGDSIWLKPLKFHLALVVYTGSLAIYAMLLPEGTFTSRRWRIYIGAVAACIIAELLWIGGAAALGTASHFNTVGLWGVIYPLMGLAAVVLTSLSLAMGVVFWRHRADPPMLALALGLVLTFVLTVPVAGTMSSGTGHLVGTPVTGARMPLMGWSREVGDLRLAHFLATHAMHVVPLAGLTGSRAAVWATAAGFTALVGWCFARALMGLPPF
ncbi:hypothetical protein [Rhodobacter calidifons]|uniref:Uncharacterized protein n=1 Tax=Rhodobacter calidifons TaxID=2715277 RepID=A0ABX0GBH7_9RHOB|nr:hypothetical protein [Rhodobacter calidifons]NHB78213.1 hypothetical protein [Rhodobacter calidifons]